MSLGGSEMAHAVPVHSMCLGSSSPSLSVGLVCDCCAGPDEARADPPPASCTLHSRPAGRQNRVFGRMDKTCEMTCKLLDSPVGKIEISGCALGLHGLKLLGQKPLQANPSEAPAGPEDLGGPGKVPEPLIQCASWLKAYFYKPAGIDELPLPAIHHPTFQKDSFTRQVLWKLLKVVKFGDTVSYQQLAVLAGHPKAARAVGGIMRSNPDLGIDEAASENKPLPVGHSPEEQRRKWRKEPPAGPATTEAALMERPLHVIFVGDRSMALEVL
ncbi:methylated-DNA--protein-cysteine methyltransferase isoform X1 [Tamandua tetradactyla]|uniref:methylated-DNA--protein-cysteine methyltransferase isoform X1 n=1 Tax=Tamandua tetradactyla TaxID=48850 RepID=UPI0040547198